MQTETIPTAVKAKTARTAKTARKPKAAKTVAAVAAATTETATETYPCALPAAASRTITDAIAAAMTERHGPVHARPVRLAYRETGKKDGKGQWTYRACTAQVADRTVARSFAAFLASKDGKRLLTDASQRTAARAVGAVRFHSDRAGAAEYRAEDAGASASRIGAASDKGRADGIAREKRKGKPATKRVPAARRGKGGKGGRK